AQPHFEPQPEAHNLGGPDAHDDGPGTDNLPQGGNENGCVDEASIGTGGQAPGVETLTLAVPGPGQGGNRLGTGRGGRGGFGEGVLPANDDGSTGFIDVTSVFAQGLNFFGQTYTGFYINNNGNITFNSPLGEFTPFALTGNTGQPIIAPFFADV